MCGWTGYWKESLEDDETTLRANILKMTDSLKHRGPDDASYWLDVEHGVAFGFRRLAILDLSSGGRQPMRSKSGRFTLIFNGEIYNFLDLRQILENLGHTFKSSSDTEVILAAIEQWGLKQAVQKFNGMFAIALWDHKTNSLSLVRDRLGIKPVYYGWVNNSFIFGSELKVFHQFPEFKPTINRNAIATFMRHGYVPAPYSIYENIYKLHPGTILKPHSSRKQDVEKEKFWSFENAVDSGIQSMLKCSEREVVEQLEAKFKKSISLRMIADVPLGAFLSGGYDSSLVVALMQSMSERPVNTFSIGFEEKAFNEAHHAKAVASHLKTNHTELYLSHQQAQQLIPSLPDIYDEPFSDSSQIPTYFVSKLTREHVTVSLSGDGGDELFGGYGRYQAAQKFWGILGKIPARGRRSIHNGIKYLPSQFYNHKLRFLEPLTTIYGRKGKVGDQLYKVAELLDSQSQLDFYRHFVSHAKQPTEFVLGSTELETKFDRLENINRSMSFYEAMMYIDSVSYLPDDILTKVDRASMAVSLEARVPLLDHNLVEFAWRIPQSMKVKNGSGKHVLKEVLYKYVPKELMDRPKMGFGVPVGSWLRGPLHDWAANLLDNGRLKNEGFFNEEYVTKIWQDHQSGERDWGYYLWDILMFQAWYEKWG